MRVYSRNMKTLFGLLPVLTLFIFGHSVQGLSEETALASPVPLKVTLPPTLLDSKGKVVPSHSMEGKLVGLYFSQVGVAPAVPSLPLSLNLEMLTRRNLR